jgi:hypothetical protein
MPISPNQGPTSGGTTVTITGTNLAGAISVKFGTNPATITANTPTSVSVISPAGIGVVNIAVTTSGGISNFLPFIYVQPPIIASFAENSGPTSGGNTINIYGYNLSTTTSVSFGANSATPSVINDGNLSVVVPAGEAASYVNVIVTSAGGVSSAVTYYYIDAPTITSVTPSSGPTSGATVVTMTGTNLMATNSMTFGGVPASFFPISNTSITVVTPAGTAGAVDICVTTPGGSATAVEAFTYTAGPGI